MKRLDNILQSLELKNKDGSFKDGLYFAGDALPFPNRVKRGLEQIKPDALFCFDDKPLILFFENPKDKNELHKKIWNFNEIPVAIIVDNGNVEIFNGFHLLETGTLSVLGNQKLDDFTYFQLVTGKTWETYQQELDYKNRVDHKLLSNIQDARTAIIKKFPQTNDEKIKKVYAKIANALLGKIIFVRYLIDRKVELNFEEKAKTWTNNDLCKLLENPAKVVAFFKYLADREKGFNGDLFPLLPSEYEIIPQEAYNIVIRLLKSEEIATGQKSLFDLYDFSIIPTEFISNVYEYFIGADNQSSQGAYYTPLFLADYVLSETVEAYISDNHTYNCKTLDPACGSGVFLVETLRKLIEQYKLNPAEEIEKYKEDIKNIVINNIFGVDKDESAVQVAIFSIYLTLLDYIKEPRDIKSFRFPNLLGTNFFDNDFFNENADFNNVLKSKDFAFIVGNPPWFRGKNEKKKAKQEPLYVQYINNRRKRESAEISIDIGNKEIAQAFLLRSSDFSSPNTKCALVSTSKVLYNLQSKDFRQYFLHNYRIERVFELAPVRKEVFHDKAIAPACVLFFNYANGQNTDKTLVEHIALKPSRFFSMFKIFSVYRHDIQTVQQDRLKQYDWLWKVLVYGSYLDFNFIKRLKENYLTIRKIIDRNEGLIIGQGITVKGGDKNDASDLVGMSYINTNKDIQKFWINPDAGSWNNVVVHRVRNKDLYKAPVLLIKKGFNNDFSLVTAISYQDAVYTDSLTGLKGTTQNVNLLRQILGYIVSSFSAYYNFVSFSSSGIEREVVYAKEILSMPFVPTDTLSNIVNDIEILTNTIYSQNQIDLGNQNALQLKIDQLNNCIINSFAISEQENTLIDYVKNIIIPLQMQHKGYEKLLLPCKIKDNILTDYANLFISRFASNFEKTGKKFVVEVWHTQQIVGMFFKVISENEYKEPIIWIDKQTDTNSVFQKIIALGVTKITDQLFVQKDIRGFEKDYFYLFKPNEKRLWHKAIGNLDVDEFMDAILKAGRDKNE